MIEIFPEDVRGKLQPLKINNVLIYHFKDDFYMQLCLDVFKHYTEARKLQLMINNELVVTEAVCAYFKVNIIYFIREYLETLQFMSLNDVVQTIQDQFKINVIKYLSEDFFEIMDVEDEKMYQFSNKKFIQHVKNRFQQLKQVFEEQDALKFMLLFFPKQFIETHLGTIKVVKQLESPRPQPKKWPTQNKKFSKSPKR